MNRIIPLLLLTVSLLANAYLGWEVIQLEEKKGFLEQHAKVLQRDCEVFKENFEVLRQKNTQEIVLHSPSNDASAVIYWNPETQTVHIDADELPPPEMASKQYQVWVQQKDKYVNLGVFNYQTDVPNFFRMKNTVEAEGFAVSLEKAQGNEQPTQILVQEKIGGK